jgi:hypothetical protein
MILWPRSRIADTLRGAAPSAVIALAIIILFRFPPDQYSFYPQCPIHEFFHLQCPGCGGTRAVAALLRGHLAQAMQFNALITLLFPFAAVYGIRSYGRLLQRKAIRWPHPSPAALYAAFSVAAVFTVVRNLPIHLF